jgi:Tol biopolymer transport system component
LVPDDTNGCADVFVRDFKEKWTRRVSVASDGSQAMGEGVHPKISADGNRVVFVSNASNLVDNDQAKQWDIFVHDLVTKKTSRANVASDGSEANDDGRSPSISADGKWVAFQSWATNLVAGSDIRTYNIFVHNVDTGTTERVTIGWDGSEPNERSEYPAVSGDGRFVAYTSQASNLVPWDENGVSDVFVWDRIRRRTIRVSQEVEMQHTRHGSAGAGISDDGRFVLFSSSSHNLIERTPEPTEQHFVSSLFVADLEHAWDEVARAIAPGAGHGERLAKH